MKKQKKGGMGTLERVRSKSAPFQTRLDDFVVPHPLSEYYRTINIIRKQVGKLVGPQRLELLERIEYIGPKRLDAPELFDGTNPKRLELDDYVEAL
jgi:hypothetical protein